MVTFSFRITQEENYVVWVVRGGRIWAAYELGHQVASDEVQRVIWNGRDSENGDIAPRGNYQFQLLRGNNKDGYGMDTPATRFQVYRRSEEVFASDRRRERGSNGLDIDYATLTNGARGVELSLDMLTFRPRRLDYASLSLEVPGKRRGYLFSISRRHGGKWKKSLSLAVLNSDVGRPEPIRCPTASFTVTRNRVILRVPTSCLRLGHGLVRTQYLLAAGNRRYDYGPDRGQYTPWARYSPTGAP